MKKKAFLMNAVLLTGATLLSRTIGISFRVYLSNQIGPEGIGLYQLVCTIYFFISTLATSGISLAVTRLVTDALAENNPGKAKSVTSKCFWLSLFMSILAGGILLGTADLMGNQVLRDPRTILPLKLLAPSLPFMAISACFRGYFYAVRKVIKTASEQLLEQLIEIAIFALLIGFLAPKGLEYACCAIVLGTTGAEILSCGYSFFLYYLEVRKVRTKSQKQPGLFRKVMSICLPVTASSCLRSGLSMVENLMIPAGLKKSGASYQKSLSGYGMLTGMVMPVITFPSAFLSSFSMLLIPEFSEANAKHHKRNIQYISKRVFQITLLFSILVTGIFVFFAKDLGMLIYNDPEPGIYISILAPVIPLMYLDSVVDGMLKGLNEQLSYLSYNMIDSVIRVFLIFTLLPLCGLKGVIIVIFVSEILNSTLSIARLLKVTQLQFQVANWLLKPILSAALPGFLLLFLVNHCGLSFSSSLSKVLLEIFIMAACYVSLLFLTRCIGKEECQWIKNLFLRSRSSRPLPHRA